MLCDHSGRQAGADPDRAFLLDAYLAQTVAPGYNMTADKWLFQHLARVLDARMLALMPRQDYQPMLKNASLNLSLATLLTQEFLDFDRATNNKDRGPLAVELPAIDFFSEPEDFAFARDFLKERGYKIILDQVKHQLLPLLDRDQLNVDLIKIVWSPALYDDCATLHEERLQAPSTALAANASFYAEWIPSRA